MVVQPQLDANAEQPLYRQLAGHFSAMISAGELRSGERLPATRELAGQLGLNRTTVSAAYELLEAEGLIAGQVGRGSFVLSKSAPRTIDWSALLAPSTAEPPAFSLPNAPISFAASRPPEELFPLADFRRTCDEVLSGARLASLLQLGPAGGYEPLRQFLLQEARREHALGADDDLLITNGCQQALDLLRRVLIRPGMRVAVEDPVYPGLKNVLREGGAELVGIPEPANLSLDQAQIAFLTPSFQNPTGLTLPLDVREQIVRQASHAPTVLIENDIYSALRYEGDPLASLKQLAPDAGSVLLRSFSKIAFPGLRLGWVIGPRPLIAALRHTKQLTDLHSDQFSQSVMLRFAESGRLAAHVETMIRAGRERLQVTLESLEQHMPEGTRWTRPQGGMNVWVTLPSGLDAALLRERAYNEGVSYLPGSMFAVDRPAHNAFRLSFGGAAPDQLRAGIEILGKIFKNQKELRRWADLEPAPAMV